MNSFLNHYTEIFMDPTIGLKNKFHKIVLFGTENITETFRICIGYYFTEPMKSNERSIVIQLPNYQGVQVIPIVLYNEKLERISSIIYFGYVDKMDVEIVENRAIYNEIPIQIKSFFNHYTEINMDPVVGLKTNSFHVIILFGTENITETFRICINYCFTEAMVSNGQSIVIQLPRYQGVQVIPIVLYNEKLERISSINYFNYVDKLEGSAEPKSDNLIGNLYVYLM